MKETNGGWLYKESVAPFVFAFKLMGRGSTGQETLPSPPAVLFPFHCQFSLVLYRRE